MASDLFPARRPVTGTVGVVSSPHNTSRDNQ